MGLELPLTHWGNIDMFQEVSPLSSRPEFSSARDTIGLAFLSFYPLEIAHHRNHLEVWVNS